MKRVILALLTSLLLTGCSSSQNIEQYDSIDDLNNKTVAVMTGSFHGQFIEERVDSINIKYLNTPAELVLALLSNKIELFLIDEPTAIILKRENEGIDYYTLEGSEVDSGFIFSNGNDKLLKEFNEFIKESKENGFLDSMEQKWIKDDDALNYKIENYEYEPTNGSINIISVNDAAPFCFISNGEVEGYSIDVIKKFASEYKYELNINNTNFDGMLSGITSGKYAIGVAEINITEERKKNMIFSDPIHTSSISAVYRVNDVLSTKPDYEHISELNGKLIGCMSGSIFDLTIKDVFPDSEVIYFNSRAELLMGLKQGKVEAFLADKPIATVFCHDNNDITMIEDNIQDTKYGVIFSKNNTKLRDEFNNFLKEAQEDGYLSKIQDKWFVPSGIDQEIEEVELTGENGIIKVCTTPDAAPFSFFKDNKYQGYEVDLVTEFARRNGYDLQIDGTSFDALISAVASEKYDAAFNGIYITEERAKSVDFSYPDYVSKAVAVIRSNANVKTNFIDTIKNKLYRTFIEEERYKLIADGILTTLLISFVSVLCGTLFGFIFFLLARRFKGFIKKIIDLIAYIIAGLPVVVILMILFYIIFAKSKLSGTVISIVGFSIIVSLSVYGMLKTGVDAIDIGQYEGALALGYTDNQALFKFVLPQALRIIMPSYRGEIISLIKSSSIVGYVTVQDLTRVSDIIRSRTYDAFFPLIVTAIIYFALAWLLTKLADYLQKRYLSNEKTKDEILKNIGQKK